MLGGMLVVKLYKASLPELL